MNVKPEVILGSLTAGYVISDDCQTSRLHNAGTTPNLGAPLDTNQHNYETRQLTRRDRPDFVTIHTYVSKAAWTLTSERCGKLTHSCNETSQCARTIRVGEKRSHPSAEDQQHFSMPDHSGKSVSHRRSKALKVSSIFPPQTILWRPGPLKRSPQRRSLAHGDPHVFGPQSEESMLFRCSPHQVYLEIVVGVHPLIQHAKLVKWFKYFITLLSFVKPTPVKILRRKFCFAKQECGGRGSSCTRSGTCLDHDYSCGAVKWPHSGWIGNGLGTHWPNEKHIISFARTVSC